MIDTGGSSWDPVEGCPRSRHREDGGSHSGVCWWVWRGVDLHGPRTFVCMKARLFTYSLDPIPLFSQGLDSCSSLSFPPWSLLPLGDSHNQAHMLLFLQSLKILPILPHPSHHCLVLSVLSWSLPPLFHPVPRPITVVPATPLTCSCQGQQ